jgi:hypothetical protein
MYKLTSTQAVKRIEDGALIPEDTGNSDYQKYQEWLDAGNSPEPADVPDPKIAIQGQIDELERQQLLPRATREFMLLSMQSMAKPEQLASNFGYQAVKAFDDQIATLRAQL